MREFKISDFDPEGFESLFIEASAGSGKTHSIIDIVRRLVKPGDGMRPLDLQRILMVTYTEKAVGELKARIFKELGGNAEVYTIHSFCRNMLETFPFESGHIPGKRIIGDRELSFFVERAIRDFCVRDDEFRKLAGDARFLNDFKRIIANMLKHFAGDGGISLDIESVHSDLPDDYESCLREYCFRKIPDMAALWKEAKERSCEWTFDDILGQTLKAVIERDAFLEAIRSEYSVAIIDEFQDTSERQWNIFKRIFLDSAKHRIIVVGDPKQSIYAFQGADLNAYYRALEDIRSKSGSGDCGRMMKWNYRSSKRLIESCNRIFSADGFFNPVPHRCASSHRIEFFDAYYPNDAARGQDPRPDKGDPCFDGMVTEPVWVALKMDGEEFCKAVVRKISQCCQIADGKTRLQVIANGSGRLRDVTYDDFVVLYKKRREAEGIERELIRERIPYSKAKENSLFSDAEIDMWIVLLDAICASDFAEDNRKRLDLCLMTPFFSRGMDDIRTGYGKSVASVLAKQEMAWFKRWRHLAEAGEWSALIESVFSLTRVEARMRSDLGLPIQSVGKIRQIADYVLRFLYKGGNTLHDAVSFLRRVRDGNEVLAKDDDLVERASDVPAVKLMTIHASKGLQFPVVISLAGMNDAYIGVSKKFAGEYDDRIYSYHDKSGRMVLGFDKDRCEEEQREELRRLLYVAFTRAQSLLIIPAYSDDKKGYEGISELIGEFYEKSAEEGLCGKLDSSCDPEDFPAASAGHSGKTVFQDGYVQAPCRELTMMIPHLSDLTSSYSSLTHALKASDVSSDGVIFEKDPFGVGISPGAGIYDAARVCKYRNLISGAAIGSAIHLMFEKIDFSMATGPMDDFMCEFRDLAIRCLEREGIRVEDAFEEGDKECDGLVLDCLCMLYRALNARIPKLGASYVSGEPFFRLCDIAPKDRFAEVRFDRLGPSSESLDANVALHRFWTGSVDLVFRPPGERKWCALDWKTDLLDSVSQYADPLALKRVCDERYSVQRVLYSHTLVKALGERRIGCFTESEAMREAFSQDFSGMYYIFVRGCAEGTSNGVYAHWWKAFDDLQRAYDGLLRR